jgi:hypothetical protein
MKLKGKNVMSPELYRFKKKLIDRKNREAENRRMNAKELSMWPAFWIAIIVAVLAILVAPR